ncbi:entericidin A/B family lipoprotein [Geminicoccaceae bacterium 1502E]|nr:entericidin A/B family lipoprotein [Geminicoccaceae bacterium 1502E]
MRARTIRPAFLALMTALLLGGSLTACNTMEGAGEDISAAGRGIENTAEKTKQKM